ncbi:amidohydrolase family protein [Microbacterium sp. NPDC076911]|uniref:amidohydrolase family protein n=1 Tax=Microbacterium sp. NPDC076911 TaxID=3154958 RepID=UPI0034137FC1
MPPIRPEHLLPGQDLINLHGVLTLDGELVSISIANQHVATRELHVGAPADGVDASGWIMLPPLADLHAHIDKAYTWSMAGGPEGSLEDAVACWQTFGAELTYAQIKINARRQLTAALSAGVTAMRSHVNYHVGDDPLRGIRAVIELREEFQGAVDLQVVAMNSHLTESALIREAMAMGVDLLGDAPHLGPDPRGELERTIALADEASIGVDIHTDETLDVNSLDLRDLAALTASWPLERTRSAGHCVSLAVQPTEVLAELLDEVAAAGVSIITNPLTNLYLQGWEHPVSMPRAIPPLLAIRDAGVHLAAGGDNVQDPFNPLGNADMVDTVAALVLAGHVTPRTAWEISAAGRELMGLPKASGHVGDPADLILVRATSVAEAIAERAPDRVVIRGGRVMATRALTINAIQIPPLETPTTKLHTHATKEMQL